MLGASGLQWNVLLLLLLFEPVITYVITEE